MTVSDELVEKAARAILAAELWPGSWDKANETERGHVLHKARAALAAILPAIQAEERERTLSDARRIIPKGLRSHNSHAFFVMHMGGDLGWSDAEIHKWEPLFKKWGQVLIDEAESDLTVKAVTEALDREKRAAAMGEADVP